VDAQFLSTLPLLLLSSLLLLLRGRLGLYFSQRRILKGRGVNKYKNVCVTTPPSTRKTISTSIYDVSSFVIRQVRRRRRFPIDSFPSSCMIKLGRGCSSGKKLFRLEGREGDRPLFNGDIDLFKCEIF
jgi:hypothetical protein